MPVDSSAKPASGIASWLMQPVHRLNCCQTLCAYETLILALTLSRCLVSRILLHSSLQVLQSPGQPVTGSKVMDAAFACTSAPECIMQCSAAGALSMSCHACGSETRCCVFFQQARTL
eukprot:GHRR01017368.1.p1 GENE.GHRR01017368.1~~GHRR01017368.1.p1  ORF type:complete len:118 (-),score=17.74 GHRR01017368.1:594-947(-)